MNELHSLWGIVLLDKKVRVSLEKIIGLLIELHEKEEMTLEESRKIIGDKASHPIIIRTLEKLNVLERYRCENRYCIKLTDIGEKIVTAYNELDKSIIE
ncbi:hypothetical protein [Acidianus brierleyi]|uniref:ArnR1-like winged helix-turn-helix domain-containing protein n=1 Tax=Acidianus brierleyi TaxID=41673 RepID=A0A2U9IC74_9CREN|nr:hypothetical protein [Acidianus brierleyi]AWR93594.1 hypothetical protein DFR85_02185 [Acidianus brierleyi]